MTYSTRSQHRIHTDNLSLSIGTTRIKVSSKQNTFSAPLSFFFLKKTLSWVLARPSCATRTRNVDMGRGRGLLYLKHQQRKVMHMWSWITLEPREKVQTGCLPTLRHGALDTELPEYCRDNSMPPFSPAVLLPEPTVTVASPFIQVRT